MKRVVIDTNVIVSSIITPTGNPATVKDLVFSGEIQMFFSKAIMDEYERVLSYDKLGIEPLTKAGIIAAIHELGTMVEPVASSMPIPDEEDRVFYDTAKANGATLITGNMKHYPTESFIMTPSDFLISYENERTQSD